MVSQKKTTEELPSGWKEHVKVKNGRKIKHFTNLVTGEKLFSKASVFRAHSLHISQGNSPSCTPNNEIVASKSKVSTDDLKANDSPEWLPHGWTVESRTRSSLGSGSVYKIYIEPLTGNKFYSRPQVMRYLQGLEDKNDGGSQQQQTSEKTPVKRQNLSPSVEVKISLSGKNKNDKDELSELPSGYTKEINTRKRALERRNALLLSESSEQKNHMPSENENDLVKPPNMDISDVQPRNGLDELPAEQTEEMKGKNEVDELQSGYKKEINTRRRALERRNALVLSDSPECKNHIRGENENDVAKPPEMNISEVQPKNVSDELPPGWFKVSKSRKSGHTVRVDPYYIEIASGYAFRSKKDVLRYLDTGDMNSCAIKPHKWTSSELKPKENSNFPTPNLGNEAGKLVAKIQPFISQEPEYGKESSQVSKMVVAEAENPKAKNKGKVNNVHALASKLTGPSIAGTHMGSGATGGKKSRESSGQKFEVSKQDVKIVHGNVAGNGTKTAGSFTDQKLTGSSLDVKTKTDLRKSKKRKTPSTPGRSSKRLAGHEPETQPNFSISERSLRAAIRKPPDMGVVDRTFSKAMDTITNDATLQQPVAVQATTSPNLAWNTVDQASSQQPVVMQAARLPNFAWNTTDQASSQQPVMQAVRSANLGWNTADQASSQQPVMVAARSAKLPWNTVDQVSQHPVNKLGTSMSLNLGTSAVANKMSLHPVVTEAETTVAHRTSIPANVSLETGSQHNNFKMQSENQAVEENTMAAQVDYWSDPCWDFAFKTLTGAIPLEDTLPGCFPQPTGTSNSQENPSVGLHELDIPPFFQQNEFRQIQNNAPPVNHHQLSTNSSTLPPPSPPLPPPPVAGNMNIPPGYSSQPSLESQTKVKS